MDWQSEGTAGERPTTDLRAMMRENPFRPQQQQENDATSSLPQHDDAFLLGQDEDVEEEGEEEEGEEEEVPGQMVRKQNFKDLLQQYDQLLVEQGVLPAFMLESQPAEGASPAPVGPDLHGGDEHDEGTHGCLSNSYY